MMLLFLLEMDVTLFVPVMIFSWCNTYRSYGGYNDYDDGNVVNFSTMVVAMLVMKKGSIILTIYRKLSMGRERPEGD